jgi:REP element-mobilizing transposase RayT
MGRRRENEPPMPDPLAYFLTWCSYGTWLPGDERGWIQHRHGWQFPDAVKKLEAEARMTEDACRFDAEQRIVVERQIAETSQTRGWELHAVNCRSNHVHVIVTASPAPKIVRNQLKAWCTRRLKELEIKRRQFGDGPRSRFGLASDATTSTRIVSEGEGLRENWWAERGSQRFINDADSLEAAIVYVLDGQDRPREH